VTGGGITFGRIFGIRLAVSPSWFLVFGLLTYGLAAVYFPARYHHWPTALYWGVALSTSLLFFTCVLLHELAHSLVALRFQIPVRGITLFIFGGVSHIAHDARSPRAEFLIALAGPVTSLLLGIIAAARLLVAPRTKRSRGDDLFRVGLRQCQPGLVQSPAGLPPGRRATVALHDLVRRRRFCLGHPFVAARAGQITAVCLIAAGAYLIVTEGQRALLNGLWISFIGWFLLQAAARTLTSTLLLHELDGVVARDRNAYKSAPCHGPTSR